VAESAQLPLPCRFGRWFIARALFGKDVFLDQRPEMISQRCFDKGKSFCSRRTFVKKSAVKDVSKFGATFCAKFVIVHQRMRLINPGSDPHSNKTLKIAREIFGQMHDLS
jgi:hypothetical protein